ncbi:MAG: hypothetical protein O8C66_12840 [Candidatus Methanoperedens sp.]|nr:hypothetical protein [Candidatus Methanoperedens sp.]MCZ7371387.1 hypothetical protein [Candidatus Methanoperedens sp.]
MAAKNFFIYFLIMLLTVYPASAGGVNLNRWVLNVTLQDSGLVEEVIQAEIENVGPSQLDGFSFEVPASGVRIIYDFDHTSSFTGQVVEQQTISGKTKITVNFNSSVEAGKKWDGRIGFTAENWVAKAGPDYSIDIPIEAPQAIVSGKNTAISVSPDADIRAQVFFPKGVEVTLATPQPFRILFQYGHMVPTWSPDKMHIGDKLSIKGSFSSSLNKIVETDDKIRSLSSRIKEAKNQGKNVSDAEIHLRNAEDYNTNMALAAFWEKREQDVLSNVGYANDEIKLAEDSLSAMGSQESPQTTVTAGKKSPGFEAPVLITMMALYLFLRKRKY